MASNVTLLSMRTQARQRADMETSAFVSDSELNGYINAGIKKIYDALTNAGEFYYTAFSDIAVLPNVKSYALPASFYKLLGVDLILDANGNAVTLKPFSFSQRNSYLFTPTWNVVGLSYLRYMIQGNNISFVPNPIGNQTVRVHYVPAFTNLSLDADTFDGINGWEEFVILDAAIKMLAKEESDTSMLVHEQQAMIIRINEMKLMRDIGAPSKIEDVSKQMPWEFWAFTSG